MAYTIDRTFDTADFEAIAGRTRAALAAEGFGALAEIDVKARLKAKLGADTGDHLILGACSPRLAQEAHADRAARRRHAAVQRDPAPDRAADGRAERRHSRSPRCRRS